MNITRHCPFCASDRMLMVVVGAFPKIEYAVECTSCGARGPRTFEAETTAMRWNTRTPPQPEPEGNT